MIFGKWIVECADGYRTKTRSGWITAKLGARWANKNPGPWCAHAPHKVVRVK